MAREAPKGPQPSSSLPPQHNLEDAVTRAWSAVRAQPPEQLVWLGAAGEGDHRALPVLEDTLQLDLAAETLRTAAGEPVGPWWQVLTLHYLAVTARPPDSPPATTFADLPGGRTYAPIYQQRVIGRLCATAGRDEQTLRTAAAALAARPARKGGLARERSGRACPPFRGPVDASISHEPLALDFQLFPRIALRLIWHGADEEFPPSATLLLPADLPAYFCPEDIVVLSEQLVARLSGRGF